MSEEQKVEDTSNAGGDQQVSVEDLQAELARARAEAAKERGIRTKLQQERDAAKKAPKDSNEEDYKALWTQEQAKAQKLLDKAKSSAIESAVTAKLTKAGVLPDAIAAAAKLIDQGMVSWDEDGGVDEVSATAAVAKLKSQYGFMFEKKVNATNVKQPAEGTAGGSKEITRAAFEALGPMDKVAKMKGGFKVID